MIGHSGFMQVPKADGKRIAWCPKCDGPSECDERGCIACAILRQKYAPKRAGMAAERRERLKRANVCVNAISHGAPEAGKTKCSRCLEVHRDGAKRPT